MEKGNVILLLLIILVVVGIGVFFYLISSSPELTDPLLTKIEERGEIIIGTDATYPPMESLDEYGNFVGLDIDIAKEIAADLGVKPAFRVIVWEDIFDSVKNGEVDMIISSITITPERAETMSFSIPYFNAGQVVIINKEREGEIGGVQDLAVYKVGVQIETTSEQEANKYSSFVRVYENYDLAKEDLISSKIDAIITDYPGALGIVSAEDNLRIVGEPFTQEFYGVAVQKGQRLLLSSIDKTIRRLRSVGEFKKLEEKWLNQ